MAAVPPLVNLQAFEAVARRRSFALAAAELHLTASAISHQVARLESQLGVRLLERSAHGVRLSAAGEQYLGRVGGALSAIASASDARVAIVTRSLGATSRSRSTVACNIDRPPASANNCFGARSRLSGQNRLPAPPAMMTACSIKAGSRQ